MVQQERITGISHKHEQQAAHALIDACFQMVESGSLTYIAPSKCGSRDQEIQQDAKSKQKQLVTIEQGALKTIASPTLPTVDIGTELKLMYALQRRGLAFDVVSLMSWETHSEWVNKLFRALMSDAIPNFSPISLDLGSEKAFQEQKGKGKSYDKGGKPDTAKGGKPEFEKGGKPEFAKGGQR